MLTGVCHVQWMWYIGCLGYEWCAGYDYLMVIVQLWISKMLMHFLIGLNIFSNL